MVNVDKARYVVISGNSWTRVVHALDKTDALRGRMAENQLQMVLRHASVYGIRNNDSEAYTELITGLHSYTYDVLAQHVAENVPDLMDDIQEIMDTRFHINIVAGIVEGVETVSIVCDLLPEYILTDGLQFHKWLMVRECTELVVCRFH